MSIVETFPVLDSNLCASNTLHEGVFVGPPNQSIDTWPATSPNIKGMNFDNITYMPHENIINRTAIVECDFVLAVTFTCAQAADLSQILSYGETCALAPFPIHYMCNSVKTNFNGYQKDNSLVHQLLPIDEYMLDKKFMDEYCTSPYSPDFFLNYEDGIESDNNILGNNSKSGERKGRGTSSVFKGIYTEKACTNRIDTAAYAIAANTATTVYMLFSCCEPVLVQPFTHHYEPDNAFSCIRTLRLEFNFNDSYAQSVLRSSVITYAAAAATTAAVLPDDISVSLAAVNSGNLYLMSSQANVWQNPLPDNRIDFANFTDRGYTYTSSAGYNAYAVGNDPSTLTVSLPQFTTATIPDKLFIYANPVDFPSMCPYDGDSRLVITNISIRFGNSDSVLSTVPAETLHRFSCECGLDITKDEFLGYTQLGGSKNFRTYSVTPTALNTAVAATETVAVETTPLGLRIAPTSGSILALEFGKHIPLPQGQCSGMDIALNIKIKLTLQYQQLTTTPIYGENAASTLIHTHFANTRPAYRTTALTNCYIRCLTQEKAYMEITPVGANVNTSGLISNEAYTATSSNVETKGIVDRTIRKHIAGGSIFSSIKNFASKAWNGIKSAAKVVSSVAPTVASALKEYAPEVANVIGQVGSAASTISGGALRRTSNKIKI